MESLIRQFILEEMLYVNCNDFHPDPFAKDKQTIKFEKFGPHLKVDPLKCIWLSDHYKLSW